MARHKPVLGLHTIHEQHEAFDLAESAFRVGMKAQEDRDLEMYSFARGYLQAVMELASTEGINRLAEDVLELKRVLEGG